MFKLDWNEIKIVVAVAEHGSLRAAATSMGMDVASVSRGLASLEARVGSPLFERTRSGSNPTALGYTLVRAAQGMLEGASAFSDLLSTHSATQPRDGGRTVVICGTAGIIRAFLMPAFTGSLLPEHPMYETAMSFDLDALPPISFISENQVQSDIALLWADAETTPSPPWKDGVMRKVAIIPYRLVASEAYLRRFGQPADLNELASAWHRIVKIDYFRYVPFYEKWEDIVTIVPAKRILSAADMMDGISLVQGGAGIALLPELSVRQYPGLVALDVVSPVPPSHLWMATRPGKSRPSEPVAAMVMRLFGAV